MFLENPGLSGLMLKNPLPFLSNFLLLAGYFYLNMYILVPHLLSKKRIILYTSVTLLFLVIICFALPWLMRYLHNFPPPGKPIPFPQENFDAFLKRDSPPLHPHKLIQRLNLYTHFVQFLIVFIVSTGLKALTQWYREKQQLQELEKSKIQAELSFLKSQIHPHFLFNCLNSIYFLTLSKDDKASKTVLSLSEFLRFVIIESESDFIPLEKEIKILEEYLNLQRLRTTEKFELQFVKEGNFSEYLIMPLIFIPFVENAFKYGISTHTHCFISIRIAISAGALQFTCDNSIAYLSKAQARSQGVGLENIRKRLALAYPDRHSLKIDEDSAGFHIKLQINIE
jgi:LytS/YehU family sensor histidine kinase